MSSIKILNKKRNVYMIFSLVLFAVEVYIALYVRDTFIRSYFGDVLVTLLIGCIVRVFIPEKIKALPIYVFIFAVFVELAQLIDVVGLLGLGDNKFLSVLVGRCFSFIDIVCYLAGCLLLYALDCVLLKLKD